MFRVKTHPRLTEIIVGQRFQKSDAPLVIWEVEKLFAGADGTAYAQIVRIDDRSMRKTVAQDVLSRGTQYVRIS